jgi:hypothetical protein
MLDAAPLQTSDRRTCSWTKPVLLIEFDIAVDIALPRRRTCAKAL